MVRRYVLGVVVSAVLTFGTTVPVYAQQAEPVAHSITPLDIRVLRPASVVPTTDGRHLVFEAVISNFSTLPLTLSALRLGTVEQPEALGRFEDKALAELLQRPGGKAAEPSAEGGPSPATIGGNSFAVALFDVPVSDGIMVGDVRLGLSIAPFRPGLPDTTLNATVPVPLDRTPAVVLSSPLMGLGWVAFNALSNTSIHRTTLMVVDGQARVPERYAIDFMKLGEDGREFSGDQASNDSWAGYGQPILAVADGVIESIRDGLPDNVPGQPAAQKATLDTIAGNQVILHIGGVYVVYAHLIPGSIAVRPGQAVRRGQVLGRLGNSGQSDAPHLHLQVGDQGHVAAADGLPFVFDAFTLAGVVPDADALDKGQAWRPDQAPQPRHRQLPVENAVMGF
ncbi:M23 family metallopeptidase [Nitrospirillum iridis]|uniref:M23ase beta-sheet core domain-containing protein n=1 Tax=Nitrospirillum iridis TaxID=765888 RepID=A0A7X0AX10_9PROT|nr:M23 family metallopeptidase [Nitrospirillum iridis]MBB6250221.1 hypothetical protein [Nitrospirillum iridis]